MKAWRVVILLMLLAAAAALWLGRTRGDGQAADGESAASAQNAYDYEAQDVVLRQMGPDGRLVYQVQARQIVQLPDSGRISAEGLTLYHDPPGTDPGSPNRWTMTSDRGELPAEGGVVTLDGHVRAEGIPVGGRTRVVFTAARVQYDMAKQELCSQDQVQLTRGGNTMQIKGLCFNVRTGEGLGSELNAILAPQ